MLYRILFIFTALAFSFSSYAGEACKAEILRYGIYAHTPDNGKTWINPISDKEIRSNNTAPIHLKTTEEIPAAIPLFFGFEYQLRNLDSDMVDVHVKVTHPEMQLPGGEERDSYTQKHQYLAVKGKIVATSGYLIEEAYEAVPGDWQFNIMIDKCVVLQQNFTVSAR